MNLIIDRNVWLRGDPCSSALLTVIGGCRRQCCVGIYLTALGLSDDALRYHGTATSVVPAGTVAGWLVHTVIRGHCEGTVGSDDAYQLYSENDRVELAEVVREQRIASVFAKHGVEVEFIN